MCSTVKISWKEKERAIRSLESKGKINPLDLIEAARDPDHPCHSDFTWDVETAAAERWRDQARALIRACKFEVLVEDVGERVVQYVPSGDDDALFLSLPKIRSSEKTSEVVLAEVSMLLGLASRVYGIALAKQGIVGAVVVSQLGSIRDQVAEIKANME